MKTSRFTATVLALAAGVLLAAPAGATTLTFNNADLLLGFRASGGTGATTDYLVNLGNASLFTSGAYSAPGLHLVSTGGNIGADLTSNFSASWNTRSDVLWSISGAAAGSAAGSFAKGTLFATASETLGSSTPWPRTSVLNQTPANNIGAMGSGVQGYSAGDTISGNTLSLNSTTGLFQATSALNSYASWQPGGSNTTGVSAFSYFSGGIEGNFGSGTTGSVLDLYMMAPGSGNGTLLGSLQLTGSGDLYFNAGAAGGGTVPEPSTYAVIAGAVMLGYAAYRRRQAKA